MEKRKINVHEGLAKIKLYDKKISKEINNAQFSTYGKVKSKKLDNSKDKEEFKINAKASFDSITKMIEERSKIKSAIILSNATTKVTIAGKEMTVAEAIELKDSIELKEDLRYKMASDINLSHNKTLSKNESVDDKAIKLAEKSEFEDEIKTDYINAYIENNKYEVVTFKGFDDNLKSLDKFIDEFLHEVDFVLSSSNAITTIEI